MDHDAYTRRKLDKTRLASSFDLASSSSASFITLAAATETFLGKPPNSDFPKLPGAWTVSVGVWLELLWRDKKLRVED